MTRKQTGVLFGVVASAIPAFIALVAVATLLLASDGGHPTQAGSATEANVRSEVTEALAQEPDVRVIISLRTARPPTAVDLPALKQEVAAKQASVISALSPSDFTIIYQYDAVPAMAGRINAAALEVLANHPDVALIEIDGVGHGTLTESVPLINADDVHTDPSPATGDGVVVAVLDTGLDTDHPDLSDDLLSEECFLSGGIPCPNGLATCSGAGCAEDDHGHGSNVTGIITSMGTNGIAATAVAPDADIRAYKVLDSANNGQFSDWLAALNDIISNQPDVVLVNMSLGDSSAYKPGNCDGMSIATAINMLRGRGTTTVIASGNDGHKNGMNYPACVANAVSVGMTYDQDFPSPPGYHWPVIGCTDDPASVDMVTCASNSDASLDLLAPGADITSTGLAAGTVLFAGTSQATPHVTGVMALVLELNPAYTPDELEYCLESSALVNPTDAGNGVTTPRVDAYESVYNCSTSPPAAVQEAIFSVLNPDITINAPNPCEAAALLTLPGITGTSCSRVAPTPDRVLTPAALGLDTGGQMTDELDAISLSEPFVGPLAPAFHFSVDSSAVGLAGCTAPDVFSEATITGEADGDIFTDLAPPASPIVGCNALFQDESVQGLNGGNPPGPPPPPPQDDMDAFTEPYPPGAPTPCDLDGDGVGDSSCPPFSIGAGSGIDGSADPNGTIIGPADLLVPPGTPAYVELPGGCAAGGLPCVAIPAAKLGLAAGDDLDALCWFDNQPDGLPNDPPWIAGIYDSDDYFFSLAPQSPTLAALGAGPGAILAPPPFGSLAGALPVVIAPAATIGLAAADNLDALKCINGGGGAQFVAPPTPPEVPHYKCYDIATQETPPTDTVTLETQFGIEEGVSLIKASSLCPPAIKYYDDPDGVGDLSEPHLKCYDIDSLDDPDVTVDLTTQFGLEEGIDVGPARQLCMPTLKEVTYPEPKDPPPPPVPQVPHYKCYEIVGVAPDPPITVDLETQFGMELGVEILEPALLCAPAKKTIEPDGEPEGDLDAPHLKCYNILGDDLVPPWEVTLETQFGFENGVQVTFPKQLCVPVLKDIVEVPEEADVKKESLYAEPEPDYGGWIDPWAPIPTAAVDEQAFLSVEQQLHNNGPYGPVTVLDIKKIDCPDPGDPPGFVFPGYQPAPHPTQCSWVFDPAVIEVEVVGGVQYYFKDDADGNGKCDPPKEPWFVGPGAPGDHTQITIADLVSTYPPPLGSGTIDSGDCIVADSTPGVLKEIGIKKTFDLDVSVPLTDYSEADIHCTGPSSHAFTIQDEIIILDDNVEDPDISNNTDQYIVYVDCLANADVKELDFYPSILPDPKDPLPYPTAWISQDTPIQMTKLLHNNGPWEPVGVFIEPSWTILDYYGQSLDPNACTLTLVSDPGVQVDDVPVSVTMAIAHDYNLHCGRGGIGLDDDGDGLVDEDSPAGPGVDNDGDTTADEDPCDSVDNDGDTLTDEDDPNGDEDCDGLIDEDGQWYIVILYFDNFITLKDLHVIDPEPLNNFSEYYQPIAVIRPFDPSYEHTCTSVDANVQSSPNPEKLCEVYLGCKQEYSFSVPADGDCTDPNEFPGCQPLFDYMSVKPDDPGEMWWNSGVPAATTFAPPFDTTSGLANSTKVGRVDFLLTIDIDGAGPGFDCNVPLVGGADFHDACLPPSTTAGVNGMVHNILGGASLTEPACPVDVPDPFSAVGDHYSWASHLDHEVNEILHAVPGAVLWARYTAVEDFGGSPFPLNLLVFDLSGTGAGPWATALVIGYPAAPPVPYGVTLCTPFLGHILILGQTEDQSEFIKVCMAATDPALPVGSPGGPHVATGVFTRTDIGEVDMFYDSFDCLVAFEADSKVTDVSYDDLGNDLDPLTPELDVYKSNTINIDVSSVEHNNGPDDADSEITFLADIPLGCEGQWLNETDTMRPYTPGNPMDQGVGVGPTPGMDPGDGILGTAESVTAQDIPEPVCVSQPMTETFELHCMEAGVFTFTFCNKQEVLDPGVDPDTTNNFLCFDLDVNSIGIADKQVSDVVFDYANAYPFCQGTELPTHPTKIDPYVGGHPQVFEVEASRNVAVSVKSIEYNAGPEEPSDSLVNFYADIPAGCEGQWVTDPTFWPFDTRTVWGDPYADPFSSEQMGLEDTDPAKEMGGHVGFESDLHFQTADYGIEEPVDEEVEILRFFELHCFEPGQYHFTFCNKIEPKPPYVDPDFPPGGPWPGNNLRCEEMVVEAIPAGDQVDKQVTDIDFDWGDQYPCAAQSLPSNPNPPFNGDQTFSVNVSHPVYLSVTSMELNAGPDQPDDVEISFYADIPANCEGRWVADPNVNPLDIRTIWGDPNIGSSGTGVPWDDPMEPGGFPGFESDLHFYTSDYKMTEPVGQTLPITRFFEVHCLTEDMHQFEFCNRVDVQAPETDPVPGNELVCETVWVLTPNAAGCPNSDASVYDTWNDCKEVHIGTDYLDDCPNNLGHAALPPDHDNNQEVDILDVLHYKWKLQPPWPYDPRFDLNIDKAVDILDVLIYKWELAPHKTWPCT